METAELETRATPTVAEMGHRLEQATVTLLALSSVMAKHRDSEWTEPELRRALARWALLSEILDEYRAAAERAAGVEHVMVDLSVPEAETVPDLLSHQAE